MLATQFSLVTMELLENGVATHFGATLLWSMRTMLQVSLQHWCKLTLTPGVNGLQAYLSCEYMSVAYPGFSTQRVPFEREGGARIWQIVPKTAWNWKKKLSEGEGAPHLPHFIWKFWNPQSYQQVGTPCWIRHCFLSKTYSGYSFKVNMHY